MRSNIERIVLRSDFAVGVAQGSTAEANGDWLELWLREACLDSHH